MLASGRDIICGTSVDLNKMAIFKGIEEITERFRGAFGFHFHGAVGAISDPSGNAQPLGVVICAVSEAHALNLSAEAVMFSIYLFHSAIIISV